MIIGPINSGVAAGGAGVATNNADSTTRIVGAVLGIYVRYNDSPPAATTDIVIKTKGNSAPSYNLLAITNAAADGFFPVKMAEVDTTGVATGGYDYLMVDDLINVKIDQANDGDSIDVWLFVA